jgi:hypothetical protein
MIVIKNNLIPFDGYKAINLFGIVFTRAELSEKEKNHELIHSRQILDASFIGFYIISLFVLIYNISIAWFLFSPLTFYVLYGLEYGIIRLFHKKQNDAYHDVSFEEEAYAHDDDLNYVKYKRMPFDWIKFLKIKSNKK